MTKVGVTALSANVRPPQQKFMQAPALAALGERMFREPSLSEPSGTSCASCHDPALAFSSGRVAKIGVSAGSRPGHFSSRNAPTLLYVRYTPELYFYQDDDASGPEPRGGLFADGRHDRIGDAITSPLFDRDEMNNRDAASVARKLAHSPLADDLRRSFGDDLFARDPAEVMKAIGTAMDAYLRSDAMAPFTSRYDRLTRGEAQLTPLELEGMRLFANPDKGGCASCHVFNPGSTHPTRSLFTDFGYDAVGVPRNRALQANADPLHFDMGLCRTAVAKGWPDSEQWCGYFKTPTLRNVAVRARFMHNGQFGTLREAVEFYATRSTDPGHWYRHGVKFDDLPESARANVNVNSVPLNRREGSTPALDAHDIDALVAFLGTLTDERYEKRRVSPVAGTPR
jgi:cytochrome c peroxidase